MKKTTLLILFKPKEGEVLLAMKKRGFGVGKWNGVGGKIGQGETLEQSLVREVKEEILVDVDPADFNQVATIDFFFENKSEFNQHVHIFFAENWKGEPQESEEMRPKWYKIDEIPFGEMWIDDIHWMPRVLKGEKLRGSFFFDNSGGRILKMELNQV